MKLHSQVLVPQLFFSLCQLLKDPYHVFPLGLQVTQTSPSPRTTPMVQMNFWPKVFPNSQTVRDKGRITQRTTPQLGILWSRVGWSFGLTYSCCWTSFGCTRSMWNFCLLLTMRLWNQWVCLWHEVIFNSQHKPWHTWIMSSLPSLLIFTWCSSRLAKFPESMVKMRRPSLLSLYRTCKLP